MGFFLFGVSPFLIFLETKEKKNNTSRLKAKGESFVFQFSRKLGM
ncbi:hypothetical protein IC582_011810 [Cucumis melo]